MSKVTIGGDRLGAGSEMDVSFKNYERSTHDLSYVWRSSMSAGTLVPFMSELCLPGDTMSIELNSQCLTLPTIGPLFGSYKVQLDVFQCPIRLYQGKLHMNMLNIGLDMSAIKLPLMELSAYWNPNDGELQQVNPSCVLNYLGVAGNGRFTTTGTTAGTTVRRFNAVPYLAYWDIYKNYYANKQEEVGYMISNTSYDTVTAAAWYDDTAAGTSILDATITIDVSGGITGSSPRLQLSGPGLTLEADEYDWSQVKLTIEGTALPIDQWFSDIYKSTATTVVCQGFLGGSAVDNKSVRFNNQAIPIVGSDLLQFDLDNIDTMRQNILADVASANAYVIDSTSIDPYGAPFTTTATNTKAFEASQEGLAIKTYQSDLFNNWISTEWIDGTNGVADVTAVAVVANEFTIDALNLAQKTYIMLNRIAVSGGSYDDWLDAVYTHERAKSIESPLYHGSLIKELSFQEVISNSNYQADGVNQPLGTLAGRGRYTDKHKGGKMHIKIHEPSYLIGIVSITPRLDYSNGNKWDMNIRTMDDLHKPALDGIGFQDLLTDQMAWYDTECDGADTQVFSSVGKQPAWVNYMTNVNRCYGNFADVNKEMFMTLNRRYDFEISGIGDLTTYIDPSKFNFIFADTNLDSQNFWMQISVKNIARRKMSAKQIPNL